MDKQHFWSELDADGVRACTIPACTVRYVEDPGCWQRKKGGHWRRTRDEPMPECAGRKKAT